MWPGVTRAGAREGGGGGNRKGLPEADKTAELPRWALLGAVARGGARGTGYKGRARGAAGALWLRVASCLGLRPAPQAALRSAPLV